MVTGAERKRHDLPTVQAAVAAGHPATVEAGVEILSEGGSAADAAGAASLAAWGGGTRVTGPPRGRVARGRGVCRFARVVCGRNRDDGPNRRRARALLRRVVWPGAEPRLLRGRAGPRQ